MDLFIIFEKLLLEGGWILYPIFIVSVFSWYLGLGKIFYYMQIDSARKNFVCSIKENRDSLNSRYPKFNSLYEKIMRVNSYKVKKKLFSDFIYHLNPELNRGLSTLSASAVITPLLGLLGTIVGMSEMFTVIGAFGFGSPSIMAHGISVALKATLTGLGTAVLILFLQDVVLTNRNKLIDKVRKDFKELFNDAYDEELVKTKEKGSQMRPDYRIIQEENERPDINLAPFVDTIMILLIFFVVTANLYVETGVDVSRPKASTAHSMGSKAILIGVTREGSIHLFGRQVSVDRLRAIMEIESSKQPDLNVVIIADRESAVGKAVEVMDQCALAGVQKVSLAAGKE